MPETLAELSAGVFWFFIVTLPFFQIIALVPGCQYLAGAPWLR
jgi:hypothetical protein